MIARSLQNLHGHTLRGHILHADGIFRPGALSFGPQISGLITENAPADLLILPGFIDTHVHGGAGGDTMDGPAGVRQLARLHAQHGTTTLLPTTITHRWPEVLAALRGVREVMDSGGVVGGADIIGAHLEGPFISPGRLGAQPPHAILPQPALTAELLDLDVIRAVTLAPELPGALELARTLASRGVRIGIGHTRADADTVSTFLHTLQELGAATSATHLYNAMGGIEGRTPGPVGALLADPHSFLEVILDGIHVHPTSFLLARAAAPGRVLLITDAMRAAGLGDGDSELGGQPVTVKDGKATLPDGTIAGSVLTLDVALRNAVRLGISLAEVSRMLSAAPAASLGLTDRGELRVGLRADLTVLDTDLNVKAVYVGGQSIPLQAHPTEANV
ncbi:N-acetylglucosamine-6-phosphate deacetylase [Deinococcus sp. QL22]|uniref:N-acetylglucosamine-6-phosphate deacetylase n=1 Tax=Deinococcus sp. QL22 TaxID=2939437 RepID=UPI00201792D0|nr:N-acetylglucosamine-6-phosphate deacetylase [Deinococcus sp. QL22]UQN05141.1 N-acetylglucosamine-6-phosphate deacetylase [Deinococcus sp. QL22]